MTFDWTGTKLVSHTDRIGCLENQENGGLCAYF